MQAWVARSNAYMIPEGLGGEDERETGEYKISRCCNMYDDEAGLLKPVVKTDCRSCRFTCLFASIQKRIKIFLFNIELAVPRRLPATDKMAAPPFTILCCGLRRFAALHATSRSRLVLSKTITIFSIFVSVSSFEPIDGKFAFRHPDPSLDGAFSMSKLIVVGPNTVNLPMMRM